MAEGYALRAETAADEAFLAALFVSVRWDELASTDWPEPRKQAFLSQQFQFQRRHYTQFYQGTEWGIVTHGDVPIGRLYLYREAPREVRIVDISLMPAFRNRGIGTALLTAVQDDAGAAGRAVSIHVEKFNPALRLYHRLGFRPDGEAGPYWRMAWSP